MFQLIISVLAIGLTAVTVVSSLNYLPWWIKPASDIEVVLRNGLPTVERAYKAITRVNSGIAPATTADPDGGFVANFQPTLRLLPAAPVGYSWSYHQHPADGSQWDSLHYFCLTSSEPARLAEWKGFARMKALYSEEQFVMSDTCGSTVNQAEPAELPAPLAATFFVTFVPGVDDV